MDKQLYAITFVKKNAFPPQWPGGLYPACTGQWGCQSRGWCLPGRVSAQGNICPGGCLPRGVSTQGVSAWWGMSAWWGVCPGGVFPGSDCLWGVYPQGVCSGGVCPGGCLPRGWVYIPACTGQGVSAPVHAGIPPLPSVDRILDTRL